MFTERQRTAFEQWIWGTFLLLGSIAGIKSIVDVGKMLVFVFRGVLDRDLMVYFVMGRSLLNGITPYVEMYDSKPPGMHVLTAISLFLTRGEGLILLLQACVLIGIPLILVIAVLKTQRSRRWMPTAVIALAALCYAAQITLYLEERAGQGEIQSIGSLFAALALLAIVLAPERIRWHRTVLTAIPMTLSFWLLEPFAVVVPLAALLLSRSKNEVIRLCIVPSALAGISTLLLNALIGGSGYFAIYLPLMLHSRIYEGNVLSLFVRGWNAQWILLNATGRMYPAASYLGAVIFLLWALFPSLPVPSAKRNMTIIMSTALAFLSGFALFLKMFASLVPDPRYAHLTHPIVVFFKTTAWWHVTLMLFIVSIAFIIHTRKRESVPVLLKLLASFLALYGTGIVISLGLSGNHFAFAGIIFIAIGLAALRSFAKEELPMGVTFVILLSIFSLSLSFRTQEKHLEYLEGRLGLGYGDQRDLVDRVDALLETCDIERYFADGDERLVFTKHSPWGPMHFGGPHTYVPPDHSLYKRLRRNLERENRVFIFSEEKTQEILANDDLDTLNGFLRNLMAVQFTEDPPACAQPSLPIPGYRVSFRKT